MRCRRLGPDRPALTRACGRWLERSTGEYSFDPDLLRHRRHAAEKRDEIRRLEAATCAMMARLDRWARATRDLLNILDAIGKAGAGFKSLVTLAERN